MKSNKKIAILLPNMMGGGVEKMRLKLAAAFAKKGYEPEFWLGQAKGELISNCSSDFPVVDLQAPRLRSMLIPLSRTWYRRRPATVLAAMWPLTSLACICARWMRLRGIKTKLIISDHNTLSVKPETQGWSKRLFLQSSIKFCYPIADGRIAVSSGVADDLSLVSGLNRNLFTVVYNPAYDSQMPVESGPNPWPDAELKLISVGSFKEQKDQQLAIKAVQKLGKKSCIVILGDGILRPKLEQLRDRLGLENQVILPGYIKNLTPWYQNADVFLLTSKWEGFGNVIVEALQHGLPVVSTDCPSGPSEILADGKYGRLTPVGDVDALVAAITETTNSPPSKSLLKQRAREFSIDKIADQYLSLLFPNSGA